MNLLELIKAGKHTAIIEYLNGCKEGFSTEEERALIERGNHEEIMFLISRSPCGLGDVNALLERGNLNEIRFYLSLSLSENTDNLEKFVELGRGIADAFVDMLFERNDAATEKHITLRQIALIRMGDHCALRRYICKYKLTQEAYQVFLKEGIAEDFLVYRLVHSVEG